MYMCVYSVQKSVKAAETLQRILKIDCRLLTYQDKVSGWRLWLFVFK